MCEFQISKLGLCFTIPIWFEKYLSFAHGDKLEAIFFKLELLFEVLELS